MLKDIDQQKMEDFAVALVPMTDDQFEESTIWECFLINLRSERIKDVLITSKGYGFMEGEARRSSTLRYYYPFIDGNQAVKLEIVQPELTMLTNEFWVSFSFDGYMFDKQYLFVEGSLDPSHFTLVPILNRRGVMIQ